MMKILPHLFAAIILSIIETSFFGSLYGIFRFTPFVLVISVYLVQHHAMKPAAFWMIMHGILLDITGSTVIPFVTLAFAGTAWIALVSAERLFSNRSFYGVAACTSLSFLTFEFISAILLSFSAFFQKQELYWGTFFDDADGRFFTLLLFLFFLFSFAKQIRSLLIKLLLLPPSRQTY